MSAMVPIALFGIIPFALLIMSTMRGAKGLMAVYLTGWLLLPSVGGYNLPGLPPYTKDMAVTTAALVGLLAYQSNILTSWRIKWLDVPIIVWCITPLFSSMLNGLGPYDGLSEVFGQVLSWGLPYVIGRVVFRDAASTRLLTVGLFLGGLLYVFPCLWEIRMSPQLHRWLYGIHPGKFYTTYRMGGYRPVVFMRHGIALGLWMSVATLAGLWLWAAQDRFMFLRQPLRVTAPTLLVVTILCRSLGSLASLGICAAGLGALTKSRAGRAVFIMLVLSPPIYVVLRTSGLWNGDQLVHVAEMIDVDRAASLQGRLSGEDAMLNRAREHLLLGWGSYDGGRAVHDDGDKVAVDGMWIIFFGKYGLVGMGSFYTSLLLAPLLLFIRLTSPHRMLAHPATPCAVAVSMFGIDSLFNGFYCPLFVLAAGAIATNVLQLSTLGAFPDSSSLVPRSHGFHHSVN